MLVHDSETGRNTLDPGFLLFHLLYDDSLGLIDCQLVVVKEGLDSGEDLLNYQLVHLSVSDVGDVAHIIGITRKGSTPVTVGSK